MILRFSTIKVCPTLKNLFYLIVIYLFYINSKRLIGHPIFNRKIYFLEDELFKATFENYIQTRYNTK